MLRSAVRSTLLPAFVIGFVLGLGSVPGGSLRAMTVTVGTGGADLVRAGDSWRFRRGRAAPSSPASAWKEPGFDDSLWESGPGGFGYGDGDDATVLSDMRGSYVTVYIRREFPVGGLAADTRLELVVDYDDGLVAWLDGAEVARRHIAAGAVSFATTASSHEAGSPETIALGRAADLLDLGGGGPHVLALEGHNTSKGSSDFSLIATLRTASSVARIGGTWVVESASVPLSGLVEAAGVVRVTIDGADATFDGATGVWSGEVAVAPGASTVRVEALDAGGGALESADVEILRVPPESRFSGPLSADTTWSGAVRVEGPVTVPAGVTLRIEAGCVVLLDDGVSLEVRGRLLAEGTEAAPVRFTHARQGGVWGRLMFLEAADSRLAHAIVEYSDCEGDHKDYYGPGSRTYHEAVVAIACHLDLEDTLFWRLPSEAAAAEGDAIAIISDDPDIPGDASANVRRCRFESIGQGVHERFSYVLVEDCFFTRKHGDNDDVDLWGESDPAPLIRHNVFLDPAHDDMINPTRCSAVIVGNVISGSDDHGIVLRDRSSPIVVNNLITDCASAGIAIENSCDAFLANNTILRCGRGLRLFDLGRWGPPYRLNPGGGTATVINTIIRDCPSPVTLADSSNTSIADRGSHITVHHSDIEGGRSGISISGSHSSVTWGAGNIDLEPSYADPAAGDWRLLAGSAGVDGGTAEGAPSDDLDGRPRPCGGGVDMGAYELCEGAIPDRFVRGDVNGDGSIDISDPVRALIWLFAGAGAPDCLDAADVDDGGAVDITDAIRLLVFLFQGGAPPPEPRASCGVDPTGDDALDCAAFAGCG